MNTSLEESFIEDLLGQLEETPASARSAGRTPVHVVYGGAHLFSQTTFSKLAKIAAQTLKAYAPDAQSLAQALNFDAPPELCTQVYAALEKKLAREAIEDFRVDFEDGFGLRSDEEEDEAALHAASEFAKAQCDKGLPPFSGIRVRSLSSATKVRSVRTLDLFLTTLLEHTGGELPKTFVVTLPKVTSAEEVRVFCEIIAELENQLQLKEQAIGLELLVESPKLFMNDAGVSELPALIRAGGGRITSFHLGLHDLTSALGVPGNAQVLSHPAAKFARLMMQYAAAGSGVRVVDSITNVLPIGPHRGTDLSVIQREENSSAVYSAWQLHFSHVAAALRSGIMQGWDLHPAQFIPRYAAVYLHYLSALPEVKARLMTFKALAHTASMTGNVFDDQATILGLEAFMQQAKFLGIL